MTVRSNTSLAAFASLRPWLYHLTARENLVAIQRSAALDSAAVLLDKAGRSDLLRTRRVARLQLQIGNTGITLRDQRPLHPANIALEDGCSFSAFVETLNRRVFFWPSSITGPSSYCKRHFARYSCEAPIVIRVPTTSLLRISQVEPQFCRYNSGAPRHAGGRASPRGPHTFEAPEAFGKGFKAVVEVTFLSSVRLPLDSEVGNDLLGPWERFLDEGHEGVVTTF